MLNKLEDFPQLFLWARAGDFHSPTQVAQRRIQVGQSGQRLHVKPARADRSQAGEIPQEHDRVGSGRKEFAARLKFHLVKLDILASGDERRSLIFGNNLHGHVLG